MRLVLVIVVAICAAFPRAVGVALGVAAALAGSLLIFSVWQNGDAQLSSADAVELLVGWLLLRWADRSIGSLLHRGGNE